MRNRQKEILSANLWWLEQRRSFQGQDSEDGRQVLPSALVPYTNCSGPDTRLLDAICYTGCKVAAGHEHEQSKAGFS